MAMEAAEQLQLKVPVKNPYQSILVRSVEILVALEESIRLIKEYTHIDKPKAEFKYRAGTGFGASEAPRGICWHKYEVGQKGDVLYARIVPPTSQNQAQAEADLAGLAPVIIDMDHEKATLLCEQLLRCYDPCISCATHFLKLDIER
jgi:coenzyme F420-reducing hydrogenase alpha subunit